MNKQNMIRIRWILVALFVLAAGCFYSCGFGGGGQGVQLAGISGTRAETGTAPESESSGWQSPKESGGQSPENSGSQHPEDPGWQLPENSDGQSPEDPGGQSPENSGGQFPEASGETPSVCYVHVCGQVVHPGVYRLREGQRIYEAVEAAGGFTSQASRTWLNLAEKVWDGMQVEVPDARTVEAALAARQEAGLPGSGGPGAEGLSGSGAAGAGGRSSSQGAGAGDSSGTASDRGKVNINTATRQELMQLKGIGEARAEDIITYRQEQGYFKTIEDIMKIPGIKDAAFQKIKDDITV